jgi:hypothetical protein
MRDYEHNFYLPFKGIGKPVYAIPGNHDWFDALDGFTANFLRPDAARAALHARRALEASVEPSADQQVGSLVEGARRLREAYGVSTGHQAAPYFEVQTDRFALLAVDTGVHRTLDAPQRAWFEAALARAEGKFRMVLLGHPLYAGGTCQSDGDEEFTRIHDLVRRYRVPVVMAGDTHDFEYYRERRPGPSGEEVTHHFVNGGGGAYLSIGTALDWPARPPVEDWAFYPRTDALAAKLEAEASGIVRPVWWWVRDLRGWPTTVEMLSGVFDFNRAPFFQSFVEVRVERSRDRVRYLLHGTRGPLAWQDLQVGGATMPAGAAPGDPVEFVVPMPR